MDLHLHTTHSDGTTTAKQIVKDCAMLGLETIAITDHDETKGYYEAVEEANKWGMKVIPGVEITTNDYHILGYGIDLENKELQTFLENNRRLAREKTYRRIAKLEEAGIPISKEKLDKQFPNQMLNKAHIAMTMMLDSECKEYVGRKDTSELIKSYLGKDKPAGQIEKINFPEPEKVIKIIHNAGGKAVLAHPAKDVSDLVEIDIMREAGLDGIEYQPRFGNQNKLYINYAKKHKMIITYGSDFHGARYIQRPLLGREHGNEIDVFWKDNYQQKKENEVEKKLPKYTNKTPDLEGWMLKLAKHSG